jgi:hypothetical protein
VETRPTRSRYERGRGRAAALRARGERLAEQAQEARKRHGSVDAAFEVVDRDAEVAGGIIAGVLAYRFLVLNATLWERRERTT